MSRHARIEEVSDSGSASDSDPMDMDPSDFDPANFAKAALNHQPSSVGPSLIDPANIPSQQPKQASPVDLEKFKNYQCLYPLYFDRTRTRVEGRRVGKEFAVKNPLARDIVEAVGALGLKALFEAGKLHPKDWANPGRIKVLVKENGKAVNPRVKNKHHLYTLVAEHLRAHPTTEASARRLRIHGLPPIEPDQPYPTPAIPRGWKIGTILPQHSPALGGGGIGEDFLKDMMAGMGQGQFDGGSGSESGGKKKKEKRKIIRA